MAAIDAGETISCTEWDTGVEATARLWVPEPAVVVAGAGTSVVTAPTPGDGFIVGSDVAYAAGARYFSDLESDGVLAGTGVTVLCGWVAAGYLAASTAELIASVQCGSTSGTLYLDRDVGGVDRYWGNTSNIGVTGTHTPIVGTWDWVELVAILGLNTDAASDSLCWKLVINGLLLAATSTSGSGTAFRRCTVGASTACPAEMLFHSMRWGYI